jgi:polyisoprenoid-binding protein YceI
MATTTEAPRTRLIPAGTWVTDPVHSSVEFSVRNMGVVNVTGHFADFEGSVKSDGTLEGTSAEGTVDVASVYTRAAKRDEHLLADDFFAAEQHPQIRFTASRFEQDGDRVKVYGDLTIKGTTRPVEFDVAVESDPVEDPWGGTRIGLEIDGQVDRRDYGLNFDAATPAGIPLASNAVKLILHLGLVKQDA